MSTNERGPAAADPKKRFSMNLLHQAGKGRFSTARSAQKAAVAQQQGASEPRTDGIDVAYRNARAAQPNDAVVSIENVTLEALPADRLPINETGFFKETSSRKELFITASSSKLLTKLFAALTIEPGSGKEVPAAIRTQVLDMLISQAHTLADELCEIVMESDKRAPLYLRAKLLQQSAEFVADQWVQYGRVDTSSLKEMARCAFGGQVESIDQEVIDLFEVAGAYTPATDEAIGEARITEAVIRASWKLLQQVNYFDVRDYDQSLGEESGRVPFSYGKDPHRVAQDLTRIALAITKENQLDINNLDLRTTWMQNSIERASILVRSEYRMLTDRALRSSFKDELLSEAAINAVSNMYEQIINKIADRARNSFIFVERNALDAMSANAYKAYLPKKPLNEGGVPATPAPGVSAAERPSRGIFGSRQAISRTSATAPSAAEPATATHPSIKDSHHVVNATPSTHPNEPASGWRFTFRQKGA